VRKQFRAAFRLGAARRRACRADREVGKTETGDIGGGCHASVIETSQNDPYTDLSPPSPGRRPAATATARRALSPLWRKGHGPRPALWRGGDGGDGGV